MPDLKGIDTVEDQLRVARRKAGLLDTPLQELEVQRFGVKRYREKR